MSSVCPPGQLNQDFDEVDLNIGPSNFNISKQKSNHTSMEYLNKRSNIIHYIESGDSLANSSDDSLDGTSASNFSSDGRSITSPSKQSIRTIQTSYSPSKKLKRIRELHKEDFEISNNIDHSDDELDDTTIMFDVPMSQSLTQLVSSEKVLHLNSLNSQSTVQSSLMSIDYSIIDADSDVEESDMMTTNGKVIKQQFYRTKSAQTIQESQIRKHYINSWVQAPRSVEGEQSFSEIKSQLVTNTRPSYLPPKANRESLKHEKEVEKMRLSALKKLDQLEKGKLLKLKEHAMLKANDLQTWRNEILPDFKNKIQLSSTRELWWRGIPLQVRDQLWVMSLNSKNFTEANFKKLQQSSKQMIESESQPELLKTIKSDIDHVFPDLCQFQPGQKFYKDLILLMVMYHNHNQYQQGLLTLTAVLLNTLQELDSTFVCLVGLLQRPLMKSLYTNHGNLSQFVKASKSFLRMFDKLLPELYDHFHDRLKINPENYLIPLIKSLFSNILPIEVCSAIIDVYIFEGDSVIWRTVLGLFSKISYKLYGTEQEVLDIIGWKAWGKLNRHRRMDPETALEVRYLDVGEDYEFLDTVREILHEKKKKKKN